MTRFYLPIVSGGSLLPSLTFTTNKLSIASHDQNVKSFSVGSMLALDQPFIACLEPFNEISLEYGSETQLYTVPLLHHEEQVSHESVKCRGIWNVNMTFDILRFLWH